MFILRAQLGIYSNYMDAASRKAPVSILYDVGRFGEVEGIYRV